MSRSRVSFHPLVTSVDPDGQAEVNRLTNKCSLTTRRLPKSKKRKPLTYDMEKAFAVAQRMEQEVHYHNDQLLTRRVNEEMMIDQLLCRLKMFQYTSRLYRLTDQALNILKKKLLLQDRYFSRPTMVR